MTVQPPNNLYTLYTSQPFTLPSGSYNLFIEGLNPNGGDNTALVDAVTFNGTLAPEGSFENPVISNYAYNPVGGLWTFVGNSGLSGNGGSFTYGNANAPDGAQVAFIQTTGYAYEPLSFASGSYTIGFQAAQRGNINNTFQQIRVSVQAATPNASTKNFVWIGNHIAEERDVNNNVTRRFFRQGEQIGGASYFYNRDHLGSVRELTDSTRAIRARYDYDTYGVRTKLSGDLDASFGYTGAYYHQPSGLHFARYRTYDATTGRWISRDPIAENGGINLYAYVQNDPLGRRDPSGLVDRGGTIWAGAIDNDSPVPLITIDDDNRVLTIVPPGRKTPPGPDWDYVLLPDGTWWHIGPGELDIGSNCKPKWGQILYRQCNQHEVDEANRILIVWILLGLL